MTTYLVTGGAGFIGSALVRHLISQTDANVVTVDKLTYAGNLESLAPVWNDSRHVFFQADICDGNAMRDAFARYQPDGVLHLAAESHVDRSIDGPSEFVRTNIDGTFTLLQEARRYWNELPGDTRVAFRFLHVSTDEVFGSLGPHGLFTENTRYDPSSPYSATKAAADHLVRAWHRTYGLPVLITNCSNNYGPYHFPEKLIPLVILNALAGESLPVYGRGDNVRDWLYVADHAAALHHVIRAGMVGETYLVSGRQERCNIDVVRQICALLDEMAPSIDRRPHEQLIRFVADRPGHDLRYAVDSTKLERDLGWAPSETMESGLRKTVRWYLDNRVWWERVRSGKYRGERLGLAGSAPVVTT